MSVCPSCNQSTSDPRAFFCPHCGFALPEAPARRESSPAIATAAQPLRPDALPTRRSPDPPRVSEPDPKAVAVGLGALLMAVVVAIVLSYGFGSTRHGSGSTRPDQATGRAVALRHPRNVTRTPPAGEKAATNASRPALLTHLTRYRTTGYSLAYPSSWHLSRRDQPVSSYRETLLESATGTAKVALDYSPGETIDPASKAFEVEAATSRTPGYRRLSFGPTTIDGRAAFAWEFMVASSDPRRADLFVTTPSGGFALLAYGLDFVRAKSAARSIASALS
jgi:hypothetical protein